MKLSWQANAGRLVCGWSEAGNGIVCGSPAFRDAPGHVSREIVFPPVFEFTRHSPFGGSLWHASWSGRGSCVGPIAP